MRLNGLTRRQLVRGLAGAGAWAAMNGRGFAGMGGAAQPLPAGAMTNASLKITDKAVGKIGPAFGGFSYDKTCFIYPYFKASNKELVGLFKLLGPSLLRIGGDTADRTTWKPNGKGGVYGELNAQELDDFCGFVKATGWQVLYAVNFGGSGIPEGKRGHTTPELAADEVAFAAARLGPALYGIEIGNEPDSYTKPKFPYADKPWSLELYKTLWDQYRVTILKKTPGVVVTGPAAGKLPIWTIPFVEFEGKSKIAMLTDHYYKIPGKGQTEVTIEKLLRYPDERLTENLKLMKASEEKTGIPFRLGETNDISGSVPGVSDSFAASLWMLDHLFTCAYGGAAGVNIIAGLGALWSPILDNKVSVVEVLPTFYGMLLFKMAGQGELYPVELGGVGGMNVSAYAVKSAAGMNVVVVNKEAKNLKVSLSGVKAASVMELRQLSPGATAADVAGRTGVTIQGATVALSGAFAPGAAYAVGSSCYVPGFSAVMVMVG